MYEFYDSKKIFIFIEGCWYGKVHDQINEIQTEIVSDSRPELERLLFKEADKLYSQR